MFKIYFAYQIILRFIKIIIIKQLFSLLAITHKILKSNPNLVPSNFISKVCLEGIIHEFPVTVGPPKPVCKKRDPLRQEGCLQDLLPG